MDMTLTELCRALKITRRTVQGYETHGLVRATGRTAKGYLLYDPEAQQKIQRIRQYQRFGFAVKEIEELMNAPNEKLRELLIHQRRKLAAEQRQLADSLELLDKMIESIN